jgi:hypothetical protein
MIQYYPEVIYYRTPFLKEIFNQDSSGKTKDTSLYYQQIIRYFLKDVNSFFKVRVIVNEILDTVPPRSKKKDIDNNNNNNSKRKSDKVEYREKTYRKYIQNLVSWGILSVRQTSMEKGTGSTFEYKITRFGNLLALLIETNFNKNKSSYDSLYSFLESYFNHESYSIDYFCKVYLKKCKEKNVFETFIEYLRKNVLYHSKYIANENDLFTQMILQRTSHRHLNKMLWKLWGESFSELDHKIQHLFLYYLKLAIDKAIKGTVTNHFQYEKVSFMCRNIKHDVIIEYSCIKCGSAFCFYTSTTVLKYLEKLFLGIKKEKKGYPDKVIKCKICDGKLMIFSTI